MSETKSLGEKRVCNPAWEKYLAQMKLAEDEYTTFVNFHTDNIHATYVARLQCISAKSSAAYEEEEEQALKDKWTEIYALREKARDKLYSSRVEILLNYKNSIHSKQIG